MSLILYTTHCPKCKVLESKLKEKGIEYKEETDVSKLVEKGFKTVPVLEVDDKLLTFYDAVKYVNGL